MEGRQTPSWLLPSAADGGGDTPKFTQGCAELFRLVSRNLSPN